MPLSKVVTKNTLIALVVSFIVFALVVMGLVLFSPTKQPTDSDSLNFDNLSTDENVETPLQHYEARDGQRLSYRYYDGGESDKALILLHGSGYHSSYLAPLASYLANNQSAHVYTPDLRGHGPETDNRGDTDYIGQIEDDLDDFIDHVNNAESSDTLLLGGHSSGGGTVIRHAGSSHDESVDGHLLLAPYIHHSDATLPENGSGWTNVNTPRIIGLSILNTFGVTAFNDEHVVSFNMPEDYRDGSETLYYSYDLQISMHPGNDYHSDIASLGENTLVLAGRDDESFSAEEYPPLFSEYAPDADVRLIEGLSHFEIINEASAQAAVKSWVDSF